MCIVSSRKYRLALTYCFGETYAKGVSVKSSIQLADGLRLPVREVKLNLRRWNPEIVAGQRTGADFSWIASLQHFDTLETMTTLIQACAMLPCDAVQPVRCKSAVPKVLASAKLPTGDRSDCGFKTADRRC